MFDRLGSACIRSSFARCRRDIRRRPDVRTEGATPAGEGLGGRPYVARDPSGRITAVSDRPNEAAAERCRVNDPDLLHFLGAGEEDAEALGELVASDLDMIRIVEHLILLLIEKRVVMLTELPKAAQHNLARRHELRSKMSD